MKILYYSESYSSHDHLLLSAFCAKKWKVEFLTQQAREHFSELRPLPAGTRWQQAGPNFETGEMILRTQAAACDVSIAGPLHSCAWDFSRIDHHPWMAVSWAYDLLHLVPRSGESKRRVGEALKKADAFLCDARTVRNAAETFRTWQDSQVIQIPWGIDLSQTKSPHRQELRKKLGWDDCKIWISTRSWAPIYDPMTLLNAFLLASRQDDELRLVMIGGGPLDQEVRSFVQENHLESLVHFPGKLPSAEVINWLGMADFYVSTSSCDGTSISLLEAMACALPVLVTDISSNQEWIAENENGWLFSAGNAQTLADKILAISRTDKETLEASVQRNRQIVRDRADWKQNSMRLTDALETLAMNGAL